MKRLFFILFALFLLAQANFVYAEISVPYVVDEKAQVIFGDSVEITSTASTTYKGLENYTTNYVNNYLHVTFTYTHAAFDTQCCYASSPPEIYLTNVDPQSTSTPTVRSSLTLYTLMPRPVPPGHETNWYQYDVQFDAAGYTTSRDSVIVADLKKVPRNTGYPF